MSLLKAENFIDGQFETTLNYLDSYEPATGKVWAQIPDSDETVVDKAVKAAQKAFPAWKNLGVNQRAKYLLDAADVLMSRLDEFAVAEARDQGKTVKAAKTVDIPLTAVHLRTFATGNCHLLETSNEMPEYGVINYSTRNPVGVAGLISPWNFPLYLLSFKIAPALMSGCTVVCKPSETTSVTTWMLCKVFQDVGLPKGVLNLVHGLGSKAGEALVQHPDVKAISFTGSTPVGRHIARVAAPMMKKISLELGGKNAALVFADADFGQAIQGLIGGAFLNQGEVCLATSRIYVQDSIFDKFLQTFAHVASNLKVGDPNDPETFLGALNSKAHLEKVIKYAKLAKEEGGTIHCGFGCGKSLDLPTHLEKGYFFPPTVVSNLPKDSRCMKEEIFGPIVCFEKFSSEEEAIELANSVEYGLCASVWSQNVGTIHRVSAELEVGTVWNNCWLIRSYHMPFGGCKQSGVGRESIKHSLETFTNEKTVCIKIKGPLPF